MERVQPMNTLLQGEPAVPRAPGFGAASCSNTPRFSFLVQKALTQHGDTKPCTKPRRAVPWWAQGMCPWSRVQAQHLLHRAGGLGGSRRPHTHRDAGKQQPKEQRNAPCAPWPRRDAGKGWSSHTDAPCVSKGCNKRKEREQHEQLVEVRKKNDKERFC